MECFVPRAIGDGERGLSPVVAVVVLFGLVALSATIVFVAGSNAVFAVQEETTTEQATKSMTSMASDLGNGGSSDVELPDDGSAYVDSGEGRMQIWVGERTAANRTLDERLGTLYYENGDTTVAYQGGGVWRADRNSRSTKLTPPPVEYVGGEDPTVSLTAISLANGDGPVTGEQLRTSDTESKFSSEDMQAARLHRNVTISVESEFYEAWSDHFVGEFGDSAVSLDHGAQSVTVELAGGRTNQTVETADEDEVDDIDEPDWTPPELSGIPGFVVNEGSELDARQNVRVDSYDSSVGGYAGNEQTGGDIKTTGELDLSNDVVIEGDVDAGGSATISNNVEVTGDLVVGQGDASSYTLVDTSSGQPTTIGGVFSTKEDAEITGGVELQDDVIVGGELRAFEGSVAGDVYVHGDMVDINDDYNGRIEGDLVVGGAANWDESDVALEIGGEFVSGASDSKLRSPLEPMVDVAEPDVDISAKGAEFRTDNGNGDLWTPIQNASLQNCGDSGPYGGGGYGWNGCTLDAGQYYLDEIDLDSVRHRGPYTTTTYPEKLTLDTTGGPVEIYVDGEIDVEDVASIEVQYGPEEHPAILYANDDFSLDRGAEINIPGDRSPLLEMYMQPDAMWRIEGGSEFVGSVYGLSDGSQRTSIHLSGGSGSSIYGGVLGDIGQFDQEGRVHFDEALRETDVERPEYDDGDSDDDDDSDDGDEVTEEYVTGDVAFLHVDHQRVETN